MYGISSRLHRSPGLLDGRMAAKSAEFGTPGYGAALAACAEVAMWASAIEARFKAWPKLLKSLQSPRQRFQETLRANILARIDVGLKKIPCRLSCISVFKVWNGGVFLVKAFSLQLKSIWYVRLLLYFLAGCSAKASWLLPADLPGTRISKFWPIGN